MTTSQISAILTEIGNYSEFASSSTSTGLELPEISSIVTSIDNCLYPNKNSRFKFLSDMDLLLIYEGTVDSNGIFTPMISKPNYIVSYDSIEGINLVSKLYYKAPFTIGKAV